MDTQDTSRFMLIAPVGKDVEFSSTDTKTEERRVYTLKSAEIQE